ncbi:hypothetical protein [Paenibacillus glacialis]|uniref:Uncharacterized protein n=1 Tax=Paenibacillus glacialis TaxID=494026 RepID=A0A168F8M7_9BACL|nr:hypothetical protein [Paenibacillus glacialis]OAB35966.1 hypothetical protein PGLA_21310 [Paenibacillus glacialis]
MQRNGIVLPVIGALLAAIIGGAIWATIAVLTEYELGLIAWGIGGLAGYTVAFLAKKQTNQIHQIIAVIASLIGILLGKYFIFSYIINDGFNGMFNSELITLFQDNITEFFGGMDILFVVFAVATAWTLPAKMSKQMNQQSGTQPQEPSL